MMTPEEIRTIHAIAERAVQLYRRLDLISARGAKFAKFGIAHELTTVHNKIVTLRLDEMLKADDANFAHDIGGIHRHLDGERLTDCFMPRFAVQ